MSLDVLRGITIAGMILVNNPGSGRHVYDPLEHAPWDGWTPTDLVFPFFLFMVGVAMTLSFDRRLARGASRVHLFGHVAARSAVLILLSWSLSAFPNLRLLIPMILMIAGCQLITREPVSPREPLDSGPPAERVSIWNSKWLGWGVLAAGFVWWITDIGYFSGPTARGSWSDWFPLHAEKGSPLRIPGVLSRIGFCYFFGSLIALNTRPRGRATWAIALMLAYWAIMVLWHAPADWVIGNGAPGAERDAPANAPFPGTLNDWIDVQLFGRHLYGMRPDPEGLLSSIPAMATVLLGTLIGTWLLRADLSRQKKCVGLLVAGVLLVAAGELWNVWFPINKKIWTSSYVLFTAGLASLLLALCYWLCDILSWRRWGVLFAVLGTNAILAFFGSGLLGRIMSMTRWHVDGAAPDKMISLRGWLYQFYESSFTNPKNASLAWALSYVALWVLLLLPLYRKRIFIRV
jgi:predicted acyltransferase